jgi:hypothetical protein
VIHRLKHYLGGADAIESDIATGDVFRPEGEHLGNLHEEHLAGDMNKIGTQDSGLPEATLFIGGPGLNPDAVTRAIGKAPYRVSRSARPRWFWTSVGKVRSASADDHLRAILDLARVLARRRAFPNVELCFSLFLPDVVSPLPNIHKRWSTIYFVSDP